MRSRGKAAGSSGRRSRSCIGNEPAERCYAKAGFAFAEEKRDPAFEALTARRLSRLRARSSEGNHAFLSTALSAEYADARVRPA